MQPINIYDYTDLNDYLNDFIEKKSNSYKSFSFRSMASRINNISYSQLFQIVKGKKKFPVSLIREFTTKILKLNRIEKQYFKALVEINHHKFEEISETALQDLKKKLSELRPLQIKNIEFNEITARPLTMIIFEMLGRPNVINTSQLNPQIFLNSYSQHEIDESLNYLIETAHVARGENGELKRLLDHIMSPNDVPSRHIRNYHKQVSSQVPHIIETVTVEEREFQSFAINIDTHDIPKAKELIRGFVHSFARSMETKDEKLNRTYNLNIQFYPITKN